MEKTINITKDFKTNLYTWTPTKPKAVTQIIHGSAEHAQRYERFAEFLSSKGIAVYAIDLRGHGKYGKQNPGFFAKKNGADLVLEDVHKVSLMIKEKYPNIPYYLFGHSMGSFIARDYITEYDDVDALIAMGTNNKSTMELIVLKILIKIIMLFKGKQGVSKLLDKLSYSSFNKDLKKIGKYENKNSWITWNKKAVEEFSKDELCGFAMKNKAIDDMGTWLLRQVRPGSIRKINKHLPILLISGKDDPVSKFGKQILKAHKMYRKYKLNFSMILMPNMRHEVLNETKYLSTYNMIWDYLKALPEKKNKG